jgi:hypothetical protein
MRLPRYEGKNVPRRMQVQQVGDYGTSRFACERLFVFPCIVDNNVICDDVVPCNIYLYGLYYKLRGNTFEKLN